MRVLVIVPAIVLVVVPDDPGLPIDFKNDYAHAHEHAGINNVGRAQRLG